MPGGCGSRLGHWASARESVRSRPRLGHGSAIESSIVWWRGQGAKMRGNVGPIISSVPVHMYRTIGRVWGDARLIIPLLALGWHYGVRRPSGGLRGRVRPDRLLWRCVSVLAMCRRPARDNENDRCKKARYCSKHPKLQGKGFAGRDNCTTGTELVKAGGLLPATLLPCLSA